MRVFFLSDLHLTDGQGPRTKRFENFLRAELGAGDLLILGGDIFDLFVGDKEVFRRRFEGVLSAINGLGARGITTYYLEGNHDFHLAGVFPPEVNLAQNAFALNVNGRDVWVAHGDLIDPDDHGYHFLRWFTRLAPLRWLVGALPGAWIDGIGRRSSHESRKYNNTERGGSANHQRLRRLYLEYAAAKIKDGYRHVLVGHSHLRDQIFLPDGGEYLNLGTAADTLVYGLLDDGKEAFEIKHYG
jgi:UDP-2,3-diacylglucosamine hydrolase